MIFFTSRFLFLPWFLDRRAVARFHFQRLGAPDWNALLHLRWGMLMCLVDGLSYPELISQSRHRKAFVVVASNYQLLLRTRSCDLSLFVCADFLNPSSVRSWKSFWNLQNFKPIPSKHPRKCWKPNRNSARRNSSNIQACNLSDLTGVVAGSLEFVSVFGLLPENCGEGTFREALSCKPFLLSFPSVGKLFELRS